MALASRAGRVVADLSPAVQGSPCERRELVLRDDRRSRGDVENDPVDIRRDRRLGVVDYDREGLGGSCLRCPRPVQRGAQAGPTARVLRRDGQVGSKYRTGNSHHLRRFQSLTAQSTKQAATASQRDNHGHNGKQGRSPPTIVASGTDMADQAASSLPGQNGEDLRLGSYAW